jgi:hypothetical protein
VKTKELVMTPSNSTIIVARAGEARTKEASTQSRSDIDKGWTMGTSAAAFKAHLLGGFAWVVELVARIR